MKRTRRAAATGIAAAGLAAGVALAGCGTTAKATSSASPARSDYSYYLAMMRRLHGSGPMMGSGSGNSMMGSTGYRWMMGGHAAPAWMRGQALPGFMMGASRDPGTIMGSLFANAPGPRVSPARAARLGNQVPAGATVNRTANRITFTTASVRITVVASPADGPDETFRIAGLVNPTIVVNAGAHVSIELINADRDAAHGLVITVTSDSTSSMPMRTARPAFTGAAAWFLGTPTAAGMHTAALSFTATTAGTYHYLCPVPGHAQDGMTGTFTVSGT